MGLFGKSKRLQSCMHDANQLFEAAMKGDKEAAEQLEILADSDFWYVQLHFGIASTLGHHSRLDCLAEFSSYIIYFDIRNQNENSEQRRMLGTLLHKYLWEKSAGLAGKLADSAIRASTLRNALQNGETMGTALKSIVVALDSLQQSLDFNHNGNIYKTAILNAAAAVIDGKDYRGVMSAFQESYEARKETISDNATKSTEKKIAIGFIAEDFYPTTMKKYSEYKADYFQKGYRYTWESLNALITTNEKRNFVDSEKYESLLDYAATAFCGYHLSNWSSANGEKALKELRSDLMIQCAKYPSTTITGDAKKKTRKKCGDCINFTATGGTFGAPPWICSKKIAHATFHSSNACDSFQAKM